MNPKSQVLLIVLGGGAALIAIAGVAGKSTTQGVVFQKPDPASVAAVTSAAEAEVASGNALIAQRSHDTLSALTTIAGLSNQLQLGQLQLTAHLDDNKTAITTTGLQVSGAEFASQQQTQGIEAQAGAAAQAAALATQAQIQITGLETAAQSHIADQQAAAAAASDAAKTTQAQAAAGAAKTTGFFSMIGQIVTGLFGGGKKP
jgi:hypothetical protein